MLRLKQCIKMFLIVFDVLVKLGILQNIVARETRKDFHSAEFVTKIDAKKTSFCAFPSKNTWLSSLKASSGAFQVAQNMNFLPWSTPPLPYCLLGSLRVRPSSTTIFCENRPALNTSSAYFL